MSNILRIPQHSSPDPGGGSDPGGGLGANRCCDPPPTDRPSPWAVGDQILWRYLRADRVLDCRPVTVVHDDGDRLAVWLAGGTRRVKPALPDGSQVRDAPLERRFRLGMVPSVTPWTGQGVLMLGQGDQPWSVWLFWNADWSLNGWYVNLEVPRVRWPGGVDTEDNVLDVWVGPDRRWVWKDEDELAACRDAGRFTDEQVRSIYDDGHRAVEVIERWGRPFCEGWEDFRPDPAWPLPELPDGWDCRPCTA